MSRKNFVPHTLVLLCLLVSIDTSQVMAADMRSFIEGSSARKEKLIRLDDLISKQDVARGH